MRGLERTRLDEQASKKELWCDFTPLWSLMKKIS